MGNPNSTGSWDSIDLGLDEPSPSGPAASGPFSLDLGLDEPSPVVVSPEPPLSDSFFQDLVPGRTIVLPEDTEEEPPQHPLQILSQWPAQMPMALAMELEDEDSILARFGVTPERYALLKPLPAFRKALAEAQRDLREQGHTFKLKCRGIAEDFLDQLYLDLHNSQVGLSTKVDIFKYLTKVGGLEPAPQKEVSNGNVPQIAIQINL